MLTHHLSPQKAVGRETDSQVESITQTRLLPKGSALAVMSALAGFALCGIAGAADLGLSWNANPETDIANYRLSYGTSPGQYTQVRDVGRETRALVTNLEAGRTYYFAVAAVNYAGMESDLSDELVHQTPPLYFNLNLAWNTNPETDVSAYRLSYGTESGQYSQVMDVGPSTRATVSNLEQGKTYYFAVTAVNYAGLTSDPSIELVYSGAPSYVSSPSLPQDEPTSVSGPRTFYATASDLLNSYLGGNADGGFDAELSPTVANVTADPDGDGISDSYLLFSYRRSQQVAGETGIVAGVEVSRELASDWLDSSGLPGVVELEEADAAEPGIDLVRVYLPTSLATNGRLFARLAVSQLAQ